MVYFCLVYVLIIQQITNFRLEIEINNDLLENALFEIYWFDLVGFYSISTIVGYLMSNPVFYVLNIYDL